MHRIAYLNCEVKSRDLSTRLLIATHLIKMGIPVVVGQIWALAGNAKAKINLPGVYLFATANRFQVVAMSWAKAAGHKIVASDEEILPLREPLPFISPEAVAQCDRFLVDTDAHAETILGKFPNYSDKFSVSGPVRIETSKKIKGEPAPGPPFILFNTGSGVANSIRGDTVEATKVFRAATAISEEQALMAVKAGQMSMEWMITLIKSFSLSNRVVVRPHPAERPESWKEAVPSNVEIVEKSDPVRWIKAARVVVHNNSTTGLEAAALGVPTLNLDPIPAWGRRYVLPEINHTVSSVEDAKRCLCTFLKDRSGPINDRNKEGLDLPDNGALNTAKAILAEMKAAAPVADHFPWVKVERKPMDRVKFTVSLDEAKKILNDLNVPCDLYQLDDSVFLLAPKS